MIHFFHQDISQIALPERFTFPFCYIPHPLTVLAAQEVKCYLATCSEWQEELSKGKMFGVLIVQLSNQDIGYLAAFSGNLAGSNQHHFFVPPIYDLLQPDGFFRIEEQAISKISHLINALEKDSDYLLHKKEIEILQYSMQKELESAKTKLKEAKAKREARRIEGNLTDGEIQLLIQESQYQKAEYKRLKKKLVTELEQKESILRNREEQILSLKKERKQRSATLQQQLFEQFKLLNANGEEKRLTDIFKETLQTIPPAGAGECALPKLLQYAYIQKMKPLAFGEFWWGTSPKDEIRHHGYFYPSCQSKCAPILKHMLIGLEVAPNPLIKRVQEQDQLETLYEDEWLIIINKPSGMLSVPGKGKEISVLTWLQELLPTATGPLLVHRLDMDTSGLLIAAKTKEIHKQLQHLFCTRQIKKRYTALLEGELEQDKGIINLPICPNPMDRPRQMVHYKLGKTALTYYEVIERRKGQTLVTFFPQTGRTHQLRVHAAHVKGLNHPIVGDALYGQKAARLFLHAAQLDFIHPVTGKNIHICKEANF